MKRVLCLVLFAVMMTMGCNFASAAELDVTGTGIVSIKADQARIILGVREDAEDVLTAQRTVNEKINGIYTALREAGVEQKDITTESIHIAENYDYSEGDGKLVGYSASNDVSIVTRKIDEIGSYIDIAFAAGANDLQSVDFFSLDNSEAQNEALKLAVASAREKAETIANAMGMQIVAVKHIKESEAYYGDNSVGAKYMTATLEDTLGADQATMVQASELQISATVSIEFELSED